MLKIIFGETENSVYHPPTYFDNQYEDEWITDPLTIAMIKDIDKSDVIGVHLIQSPVLGPISTKEISGGDGQRGLEYSHVPGVHRSLAPLRNQQELPISAVGNDLAAIGTVIYGEVVGVLQLQAAHHGEVIRIGGFIRGCGGLFRAFRGGRGSSGRRRVVSGRLAARAQGQHHGQGQQRRCQPVQVLFHHVLSFVG